MNYEAIVINLKENGKADVVIQPPGSGVHGASKEVNAKVCHCATAASSITIEALNSAGAGVGDRVSIMKDSSALLKNCGILLGIPLAGLIIGIILNSLVTGPLSLSPAFGLTAGIGFALMALVLAIVWYKRSSTSSDPVIDRILRVAEKTGPQLQSGIFPLNNQGSNCGACSGNFPR